MRWKISAGVNGGLSGGSSLCRTGSEDPHRRQRKFVSSLYKFYSYFSDLSLGTSNKGIFCLFLVSSPRVKYIIKENLKGKACSYNYIISKQISISKVIKYEIRGFPRNQFGFASYTVWMKLNAEIPAVKL